MNYAKQYCFDAIKAIAAGVVISFGATVFLIQENRMFSSFLFSLGLFVVCTFNLNLFTGKVGFLADVYKRQVLIRKRNTTCLRITP